MNRKFYLIRIKIFVILGVLLILNLGVFLRRKNEVVKMLTFENENLKNTINFHIGRENDLKNTMLTYFVSRKGTKINGESYIKNSDSLNDSIKFKDIKCPALVFYFNGLTCTSCITETIKILGRSIENYPECNVIVLTSERMNLSTEGTLKRMLGNDTKIFINDMKLNLPDQNQSYFFLLNRQDSLVFTNCFCPNIDDPDITKAYLTSILSTF